MKKFNAVLSVVVLLAVIAFAFTGCGEKPTGYEGKYVSVAGEMMGIELTGDDISGWAIELDNGGKGKMEIEGETGNIKWSVEGETITVNVEGEEMKGTIDGDKLVFDDILGSGMKLTFAKEGTEAASE